MPSLALDWRHDILLWRLALATPLALATLLALALATPWRPPCS